MKEQIKLRMWVRVVITIILLGVIFGSYTTATKGGNFSIMYWFLLIPGSWLVILATWSSVLEG